MKKETMILHSQIANNMMYHIYEYLDSDINIDEMALEFGINKFHFHKLFKEQIGTNIYETIKSIRLQKASNLLISNNLSTVTKVAQICGYSSVPSFIRAFKERFKQTPNVWRKGGYKEYTSTILSNSQSSFLIKDYSYLSPKIVRTDSKTVYYIRNKYNHNTTQLWQKLITWVYSNDIQEYEQMGIYHDNPIITAHEDCYYVAAIAPKDNQNLGDSNLPSFKTPPDVCACFEVEGEHGDILKLIQWVYHKWLPNSGFETTTNPSYTILEKNPFLEEDGLCKVKYYVPIRYL